jgi:hypothetical protein
MAATDRLMQRANQQTDVTAKAIALFVHLVFPSLPKIQKYTILPLIFLYLFPEDGGSSSLRNVEFQSKCMTSYRKTENF